MCSSQSPWAINDTVSYGFAAVKLAGSSEQQWCCQCYELTFTSGPVKGKKFVVQAVNTGGYAVLPSPKSLRCPFILIYRVHAAIWARTTLIWPSPAAASASSTPAQANTALLPTAGAPSTAVSPTLRTVISSRLRSRQDASGGSAGCVFLCPCQILGLRANSCQFGGADNPEVTFKQVSCPAEITAKTGCSR
jgi:glycosyl hydrolase family 45